VLQQRANRIALQRPRIRIRILARQIGGFIESVFGHADLRERRRNTERAVQFEQQRPRVSRILATGRACDTH
jgi:hypothetical protein